MSEFWTSFIQFMIAWGPTLLFTIIIMTATLLGFLRGLRKSAIFFIHAIVIFAICLIIYACVVENEGFDTFLLNTINLFMGADGLEKSMGVSTECTTLRQVIMEFIPKNVNFNDGIAMVLKDNGRYLATFVNLIYHLVVAVVLYILYLFLIFILYIVYLIFYPEHRYKKKRNKKYMNGLVETSYKKRRWFGALVGFSRGLVNGLIMMSFIGSIFYIAAGGKGQNEKVDYDTSDLKVNNVEIGQYLDLYESLNTYGNQGIYQILNVASNQDDIPYYLFACNVVFSGGYVDESGLTENIYFTEELGALTGFAEDTFDLVLKYAYDDIKQMLKTGDTSYALNEVLDVLKNEDFQKDFRSLIDKFESKTYFIDMTYSLISSVAGNIDKFVVGLPEEVTEVLKILFQKGYLSESIPYEATLEEGTVLGYIGVKDIINKEDILTLYDLLMDLLKYSDYKTFKLSDVKEMVDIVMPYIKNMSIFSNAKVFDPVFERVYAYFDAKYFKSNEVIAYDDARFASISWTEELTSLLSLASHGFDLFLNMKIENDDYVNAALMLFDSSNEKFDENMKHLNAIIDLLANSKMLGYTLNSSFIAEMLEGSLESLGVTVPDNLSYANTYDENGKLEGYGEIYYLLSAVRAVVASGNSAEIYSDFMTMLNGDNVDMLSVIKDVIKLGNTATNYGKPLDHLTSSVLLSSIISGVLLKDGMFGDLKIYADSSILLKDKAGNPIKVIETSEIKLVVNMLEDILNIVSPLMNGEVKTEDLIALITSDEFYKILDSKLIEGTISYYLANNLESDALVIPMSMKNNEGLVSTDNKSSQLKYLLAIIKLLDLDLAELMNGGTDGIAGIITSLSNEQLELILGSDILYYTISNMLATADLGQLSLIIPNSCRNILINDTIEYTIKKDKLIDAFNIIFKEFDLDFNNVDVSSLLDKVLDKRSLVLGNEIITATISSYIATNGLGDDLIISKDLKTQGEKEYIAHYFETGKWYTELPALFGAIDELGKLKIDLNELIAGEADLSSLITSLKKDNLEVMLKSEILYYTVSDKITTLDLGAFNLIVPKSARVALSNDTIPYTIKKDILIDAFDIITNQLELDLTNIDTSKLLPTVIKKYDVVFANPIITCSISNYVAVNGIGDAITIPDTLKNEGSREYLEENFDKSKWKTELPSLFTAIDEMVDLNSISLDDTEALSNAIISSITSLNKTAKSNTKLTKLDVIYKSEILKSAITNKICDLFKDKVSASVLTSSKDSNGMLKQTELSSLVDALVMFEIDPANVKTDDLADKVVGDLFNYDVEMFDAERTKLDVLFGSKIIAYFISTKLDDVLTENELIDAGNLPLLKTNDVYKKSEVSSLIMMLKMFISQDDFNKIVSGELDSSKLTNSILTSTGKFNEKSTKNPEKTNLEVLYENNICGLIITKQLKASIDLIPYAAYTNSSMALLKEAEVAALFDIASDLNVDLTQEEIQIGSCNVSNASSEKIANSTIISAMMYGELKNISSIIIPKSAVVSDSKASYIKKTEFVAFFDAAKSLGITDISSFSIDTTIPSNDKAAVLSESDIMRASITKQINFNVAGASGMYAYESDADITVDINNEKIAIVTKEELKRLISAVRYLLGDNGSFDASISSASIMAVFGTSNIDEVLSSSIICNFISDYFSSAYPYVCSLYGESVALVKLDNAEKVTRTMIKSDKLIEIYNKIK